MSKQLDLFTTTCSIEEIAKVGKQPLEPTSPCEGVGRQAQGGTKEGLGEISTPPMSPERLAHYRAKLAALDATGYDEIIRVIESDTILEHNSLGKDLTIVETAIRAGLTITGYYSKAAILASLAKRNNQ